ncbi:MAG: hypothetical protein Q4G16_10950 [Cruoricaptor ignavus]|nr:hypothetical protein [Cruoricaptor ignavus]
MDFKNKSLIILFLFIVISCVSNHFDEYKPYDNLKIDKNYYEIIEPNNQRNFVKIGTHTIFNRQNSYYIYIAFKNKLSSNIDVKSLNYGKIEKSPEDETVYLKKINANNLQTDTIYLKFPNKIYKFYNN